ncbi:hypothetical protein P7228_13860 [Altererythrobacter arenosus]|uniref:Major facilitator superfamily (MFS) profile domain-containing protein n=1 Tax=Altererythrobacter arenosus TaxID=3032592 RepID=A0ABY8FPX4_9SPHN|nr:hypothetical protein [Altererythrobacter sp. CAU 1644]WFL77063.1 hypothetical protein P7228_13860 [Altererythrobacter sp. CAU 1644]
MRLLVETGRFFVTALAVGFAIPFFYAMASIVTGEHFSFEAFLAVGAISFVLGLLGGVFFGLPTLWILKRQGWAGNQKTVAIVGTLVGAVGGVLLSVAFWQGHAEIILAGLWAWALMGAVAGLVSALVWFCLHVGDSENQHV